MPEDLIRAVCEWCQQRAQACPDELVGVLDGAESSWLARPPRAGMGEWAVGAALRLARPLNTPPVALAADLAERLAGLDAVASATVEGPGFINLRLTSDALWDAARTMAAAPGVVADGSEESIGDAVGLREARAAAVRRSIRRVAALARAWGALAGESRMDGSKVVPGQVGGVRLMGREDTPDGAVPNTVVCALGVDVAEYVWSRTPWREELPVRTEDWARRAPSNPAFAVQHAYAETRMLERQALAHLRGAAHGEEHVPQEAPEPEGGDRSIVAELAASRLVIADAARRGCPHLAASWAERFVDSWSAWRRECQVLPLGPGPLRSIHRRRLEVNAAAAATLHGILTALGLRLPTRL